MHEGCTEEMLDYEQEKISADWHALSKSGVQRTRRREEHADERRFKLRGYRGHGHVDKLLGFEDKTKIARRRRLRSGTEVKPRKTHPTYVESEFPGPFRRPVQPWNVVRAGFNIGRSAAQFRRKGVVPMVSIQVVRDACAGSTDKWSLRLLAEMERLLLLRSGDVEENPGPYCLYSGQVIRGDWYHGNLVCPKCHVKLDHPKKRYGKHYKVQEEDVWSGGPISVTTTRNIPPSSTADKESVFDSVSEASSASTSTSSKVEVQRDPVVLDGHVLSQYDKAQILKPLVRFGYLDLISQFLFGDSDYARSVRSSDINLHYDGEKRVVPNRNVLEHKQPLHIARIYKEDVFLPSWRYRISLCLSYLLPIIVGLNLGFWAYFYAPLVLSSPLLVILVFVNRYYQKNVSHGEYVSVALKYVPHLVSSVVQEYERGTNIECLETTVRQRIRRMASLPIPDIELLDCIYGSEVVIKYLVIHSPFFVHRAGFCLP